MKNCKSKNCKENNPQALDNFYKGRNFCKGCTKKKSCEYRNKNPDKIKNSKKKYYYKNAVALRKKQNKYRKENIDKVKLGLKKHYLENSSVFKNKRKEYYSKNKEQCKLDSKNYRKNNPTKVKNNLKIWSKNNRSIKNSLEAKRRAAKLQRTPPWLTKKQLLEIQQFYKEAKELSWLSESPLEVDHIIPLQGKSVSGLHVPWNLQILPRSLNTSKGNR